MNHNEFITHSPAPIICPYCKEPATDDDYPLDDWRGGYAHWKCYEPYAPAVGDPDY